MQSAAGEIDFIYVISGNNFLRQVYVIKSKLIEIKFVINGKGKNYIYMELISTLISFHFQY